MYGQQLLARIGVAAFAFSLVVPTAAARIGSRDAPLIASTHDMSAMTELGAFEPVRESILVPLDVRALIVTPAPTPTPAPNPVPVLTPTAAPPTSAPPAPPATYVGGPAVIVTASWYGPGFYGNRLPCWRWLEAKGLPIQFQADTWGVAHKTLPCGTTLVLRHGASEITVPVVDRGPYIAGRELDLSPRVKAALGCTDLCTVVMQVPR